MADQVERLKAALAERYVIERELGRGGMATVYLARDLKHERQVAVKVLRPELAAALGPDRFLQEIKIAANLQHPHILPLYDSGEADGFLYYVMPFVDGETLDDRLDGEKQLGLEEAVRITTEVADALDYAHRQNVIHRDIKPENILLSGGHAVVADFGIARALDVAGGERLTETGLAIGTPAYMSPEQVAGSGRMDGRADLYALGCVLYEMLAGETPFTGPTAQAILARQAVDPVPPLRTVRSTVPIAIEQAVNRALAKVPADRFATAAAFAEALTAPTSVDPRPCSVAVLPFLNLSADPENEYFADGITEDVIAQLSKIHDLKVISRTSVMPFKKRDQGLQQIAATLGVATVLEGSVRRAGDRVRIMAQLIDAGTDQHLWAESYDRGLSDIFAIQSDVALNIAAALRAELSPEEETRIRSEPTNDLQAYQLYLQGRHCVNRFTEEGMRKGIEYFEQAIEKDPDYALAYAALAIAYTELGLGQGAGHLRPEVSYQQARDAVVKALALDAGLGDAHCAAAFLRWVRDFDWTGAEEEFNRALQLSPGSADTHDLYGRMCSELERYDEAIALEQRAQELDPVAHRSDVATTLIRAGRYDEALQAVSRAVELDPHYARSRATLGWAYLMKGLHDEGLAELERAVSLSPGATLWLAQLGQAYAIAGKVVEAREVLRQLEVLSEQRYVSPYHLAYVYTGLGEVDQAVDCLERAYEDRAAVSGIRGSFLFTSLRSHPRFEALLRKMNLA
jgi:serine/threonine-protein kinase